MSITSQTRSNRAGKYVKQPAGYHAFIPKPLPPNPTINIDFELLDLVAQASQAVGQLNAAANILPNPDLFVRMYVRTEALLSSQIEGTQATLIDVLEYEASGYRRKVETGAADVVNYVESMNYGLQRLEELPLSNRLLREIHSRLLKDTRGADKLPGEFRTVQNYIGPDGCDEYTATFVPPPPDAMIQAMGDLEMFLHSEQEIPDLLRVGLIHGQFETIHPFLDGNGRMGRLLITFYLCRQGILKRPILYLSAFLREHQDQYYTRLQAIRDSGDWEGWLKFFLTAIRSVSHEAANKVQEILALRESHRTMLQENMKQSVHGLELLDLLFEFPYSTIPMGAGDLRVSYPTARSIFYSFEELGLLQEVTGRSRDRVYVYRPYLNILVKSLSGEEDS